MKKTTEQFLDLFFNPGEEICCSPNQYAYPSRTQNELDENNTVLVAINPIKGQRNDKNVTAYRSFMVECDDMPVHEQLKYIKEEMKFPFSYCCFSGGKSLHFALVLDHDVPSEHIYRHVYQWILNILDKADQKTKNPSRSVRFPGIIRPDTGKEQKLYHMGHRVDTNTLTRWLNQYPDKAPKPLVKQKSKSNIPKAENISPWAIKLLKEGIQEGSRNQMWMSIGCEFALNGFGLDHTIHYLDKYFEEESDFSEREWLSAITSGWNYADKIIDKRQ